MKAKYLPFLLVLALLVMGAAMGVRYYGRHIGLGTTPHFMGHAGGLTNILAPGSDLAVIFNDGGILGAETEFNYNKTTDVLTVDEVTSLIFNTDDLNAESLKISSNSWVNIPVLAEGDNVYASSNGTPYVVAKYAGVQTTNLIGGSAGTVSDTAFASSYNGVTTIAPSKNAFYDWGHTFDTNDNGLVNVLDTTFNSGSAFTGTTVAPNSLTSGQFVFAPTFVSGQSGAGLYVSGAGVGSAGNQQLIRGVFNAGYTGSGGTFAGVLYNNNSGVGVNLSTTAVNGGAFGVADGTTTGINLGNNGLASGGNLSAGVAGFAVTAKNSAQNVGVLGYALNTGTGLSNTAGAFLLRAAPTTIQAYPSAAIFADNGTTTSPIFIGADNGVTVFTIADGGATALGSSLIATQGIASLRSNLVAPSTITVTASPFSWTNTITANVVVYIDGISVTGTVAQNGTTVFNSIGQNTLILQAGEWTTITYTLGSPTATWKPF